MNISVILIEIAVMLLGFTVLAFLFVFAWMLHFAGAKTFWQGVVPFAILAGFLSSGRMIWMW